MSLFFQKNLKVQIFKTSCNWKVRNFDCDTKKRKRQHSMHLLAMIFGMLLWVFFHYQSNSTSFLLFTNMNGMNIRAISNLLLGDKYIGLVSEI